MKLKDTCSLKVKFPKKHVKKQRHNFVHKVSYSQSYGFSGSHVWMWELDHKEGWVLKNWCFQSVVQEKTLKVPWTARRSNQSVLKEINPEYLLEGLILKLKLQYFGHLMERADSLEKILMLGKIEGKRRGEQQRMKWLDSIVDSVDMNLSKLWREWRTEVPSVLQFMRWQRIGRDSETEQQTIGLEIEELSHRDANRRAMAEGLWIKQSFTKSHG